MHEHAELMTHLAAVEILVDLRFLAMDKCIAEKERAVLVGVEFELFTGFDVHAGALQTGEICGEKILTPAVICELAQTFPDILYPCCQPPPHPPNTITSHLLSH